MKSFDEAIRIVTQWKGAIDGKDIVRIVRFAAFVPTERLSEIGFTLVEGVTHESKPWTHEEVLVQLKNDVEFGYEKAEGQRGISADCMFHVVNMWCHLLENGLAVGNDYDCTDYHLSFFARVMVHYGWE